MSQQETQPKRRGNNLGKRKPKVSIYLRYILTVTFNCTNLKQVAPFKVLNQVQSDFNNISYFYLHLTTDINIENCLFRKEFMSRLWIVNHVSPKVMFKTLSRLTSSYVIYAFKCETLSPRTENVFARMAVTPGKLSLQYKRLIRANKVTFTPSFYSLVM